MTFDSKMTFEKHLRSVSRAASQRLGILRKSWRVFHDRSLLGRCFRGLSCQCGLHAVLWLHIGTLMHRLAAEPRSTARLLFSSWCPSGTILLTPYSMVWDWRVSREGIMLFYWPKLLYPYYILLLFFPFSSFCL